MKLQSLLTVIWVATALPSATHATSLQWSSDSRLTFDLADKPVPAWSGGALIALEENGSTAPSLKIFGRDGVQQFTAPITISGASMIWVYGFSRGSNGTLAVCGLAMDGEGRRGSFIFIAPPNGGTAQLIRTGQYAAYQIAVASDGTIWTAGIEALDRAPSKDSPRSAVIKPYLSSGAIRHFDAHGKMTRSFVPQSTIGDFVHLTDPTNHLEANGDRIAWYCPREGRYFEIAGDGSVLDLHTQPPGPALQTSGLALTRSGSVFLSGADAQSRQWTVYVLNKATGSWTPVKNDTSFIGLYGAEDDTLVTAAGDRFIVRFLKASD